MISEYDSGYKERRKREKVLKIERILFWGLSISRAVYSPNVTREVIRYENFVVIIPV